MPERKLIGIVDDNIQTAVSISQTLDFNGFQTFQAYNEKSLKEELEDKKPDLIIISANMIKEQICVLLRKLRTIVLIISHDKPKVLCGLKNIKGTITKPIKPETLLKKVRKELDLK